MRKLILLMFVVFALKACTKDLKTATQKDTKWVLSGWPGKTLPTKAKATLNISADSKVGGKAFCNTYGGNVVINGNAIQFSKLFGTKMYCEGISDFETKYLADLEKVTAGKVSGRKLHLYANETLLLVFDKTE